MCGKSDSFTTETFIQKLIFVDDDFILMELDQNNEILFHVESGRTLSSFNSLSPHLKFNEKFFPVQFGVTHTEHLQMQAHIKQVLTSTPGIVMR